MRSQAFAKADRKPAGPVKGASAVAKAVPGTGVASQAGAAALSDSCACGGGCPRCVTAASASPPGLRISSPGDPQEAQADAMAARLLAATQRLIPSDEIGPVRLHTGDDAAASAASLGARAYTVGNDIVFGHGQFSPHSREGRYLLAHELAHVVQQRSQGLRIDRTPAPAVADPLCKVIDVDVAIAAAIKAAASSGVAGDEESRRTVVQSLKPVRRCTSSAQHKTVLDQLDRELGTKTARRLWAEAGTAFGGYVGMYPSFAGDIKGHLARLGTSEQRAFSSFELSGRSSAHRRGAKRVATSEKGDLASAHILYFRGHQFAQYKAPGLFSDGNEEHGFDLRYVEQAGGFSNVRLLISTSCATLCKEAFDVFHGLFPNAVILGYRKSAPIEGGLVRTEFAAKLRALSRGLLLDQPVDIAAVVTSWRAVAEHRHAGQTGPQPAWYAGGDVNYWDGKAWKTVTPSATANACYRKGDFSGQYPAPPTPPSATAP